MANNNDKFISRENAKNLWGYMIDLLTGKQNKLTFDDIPTQSSDNPVKSGGIFTALAGKGTYSKPQNGIPKADLESTVQTSLGKADTALQSFTETDPTVPSWAKQTNKPSYSYSEIQNTPTLGTASAKDVPASGNASSTQVVMGDDTRLSDARTPTAHNQVSSTINAMTSYSKPSSEPATPAIQTSDSLNTAIGKLEYKADTNQTNILLMMNGVNHNMIYRGNNLGASLTDAQHTALSSGNFTDLYLGDYWTKSVTIPDFYELTTAQPSDWTTNYTSYYTKSGNTYTAVTGSSAPTWADNTYYTKSVPTQTVTLKAVIADFDTFYAGYASSYAGINTHHAGVIVTGFNNVVWNKTNSTAGGYVSSLIHKWLVGSVLPQIESWFGSAKVLSHQKLLTNAITGDAASGWAWSSQKISLLSECQLYGMKVWGGSKATNGAYEPGEAFKKLDVFNHIDANLLFGNKNIWCRDITSAVGVAILSSGGGASYRDASSAWVAPAALILLS